MEYKQNPNNNGESEMTKKTTMRALLAFRKERAIRLQLWRQAAGFSRTDVAKRLGCCNEMVRLYEREENPAWIPAHRIKALREMGCPISILMLDGKMLQEIELER